MNALYDFLPAPSSDTDGNAQRLYPRIVSKGTVTFKDLTEKIANHSGLSKGTVLAVMDEIEYWATHLLSDGYRVQIGRIPGADRQYRHGFGLAQSQHRGVRPFGHTCPVHPVRQSKAHGLEEIHQAMLWERAPCTCRAKNPAESEGLFTGRKADPPPIVLGRACIYHPESLRRADRTSQDHRLARLE